MKSAITFQAKVSSLLKRGNATDNADNHSNVGI
jgi:hypothetical protein